MTTADTDGAFSDDPVAWFLASFARAMPNEAFDASRAALATAGADGMPHVRFVLVKIIDERGFAFFTNLASPKARALRDKSVAALAFHWPSVDEQFRIRGPVVAVADDEADAYFASRPRGSQLAAWASRQSEPIADRAALDARFAAVEARFEGQGTIPRPPFWSGLRVVPDHIEVWRNREARLHDRWLYLRTATGWSRQRLQP